MAIFLRVCAAKVRHSSLLKIEQKVFTLVSPNLARQIELFQHPLDLFHITIW